MSEIPVNSLTKDKNLLQVISLGVDMPYDFRKPHRHEYFEFFVFNEGGGAHYIDFTAYPIAANSVHIIFPGQIHMLKRAGAQGDIVICLKEYMNSLDPVFYSSLFQNNYTAPTILLPPPRFAEAADLVRQIQQELKEKGPLGQELCRSYLSILLTLCIRSFTPPALPANSPAYGSHDLEVYKQFLALLESHFIDKPNVSFYAQQLAVTPKTLNACIKKICGKTCVELIQERTMTEAKRLLLYTDDSSKEIAYRLNFKDNSYFTRFFTRLEGQTPSAFRSYWEEKYHA